MAELVKYLLANSGSKQLLELLAGFLDTEDESRDAEFYSSLESVLSILKESGDLSLELVSRVTRELCLPVIHHKNALLPDHRRRHYVVCEVIALCCAIGPEDLLREVSDQCLETLSLYTGDTHTTVDGLPVEISLDLIGYLLKHRLSHVDNSILGEEIEERLFEYLLRALRHSDELMCAKITGGVIPQLLSLNTKNSQHRIQSVWILVKNMAKQIEADSSDKMKFYPAYAVLCGLADFFFGENNSDTTHKMPIFHDPEFWQLIQQGLKLQDPLSHKRAMYLLKRVLDHIDKNELSLEVISEDNEIVFFWNHHQRLQLIDIWQEYVLLMETLDESQVHLIIPVLPRLSKIVIATERKQDGTPAIHVSWLTTMFYKASKHESKFMRKWALLECLTVDLSKCPFLSTTNWKFLMGPFQSMLNEYTLFGKEDENTRGEPNPVEMALHTFYKRCHEHLPQIQWNDFLCKLIAAIEKQQFTAVPLVFVSRALANIPPCPAWGVESLISVRHILAHLKTHAIHLRIATMGFLFKAVTKLYEPTHVSWDNIHSLLCSTNLEECFSRGNWLWKELSQWLWTIESKRCVTVDDTSLSTEKHIGAVSLCDYLRSVVKKYLSVPQTHKLSFEYDLNGFVYMLIAAGHDASNTSPLQVVLGIVVGCITHAHVYTPEAKVKQAVALLTAILRVLNNIKASNSTSPDQATKSGYKTNNGSITQSYNSEVVAGEMKGPTNEYSMPKLTSELVNCLLRTSLSEIFSVLLRKMTTAEDGPYTGKNIYLELCKELHCFLLNDALQASFWPQFYEFVESIAICSIDTVQQLQDTRPGIVEWKALQRAMLCMAWVCDLDGQSTVPTSLTHMLLSSIPTFVLNIKFNKPDAGNASLDDVTPFDDVMNRWGYSVSQYITSLWSAVSFFLQQTKSSNNLVDLEQATTVTVASPHTAVLEAARDALDIANIVDFPAILRCLGLLVPRLLVSDIDLCSQVLDVTWKILQDAKESDWFWLMLGEAVAVVFCSALLMLPEEHSLTDKVKDYWSQLRVYGDNRAGVLSVVINQFSKVWEGADDVSRTASLLVYHDVVLDASLFGSSMQKSQQIESDVETYLRNLGNETSLSILKPEDWRDDTQVRVTITNILLSLDMCKPRDMVLAKHIARSFLAYDKQLTLDKPRIYLSSRYHRKKHRAWQGLLILIATILKDATEREFAQAVLADVFTAMLHENQNSVKNYQEWTAIHILSRYPELESLLWKELSFDSNKRTGRTCSLITIATLLSICYVQDMPEAFFSSAMTAVFPWVMINHRAVRVYAQVAIQRLWSCCITQDRDSVMKENSLLKSCIAFMETSNDNMAEKKRLLENYFFFDLHPLKDFSIESIYLTIPRLSGIIDEEWVPVSIFKESSVGMRVWKCNERHGIPLYNPDRRLAQLTVRSYSWDLKNVSKHILRRIAGESFEQREILPTMKSANQLGSSMHTGDVQKKIIAWKIVPPEEVMISELQEQRMVAIQRSTGGNLVVVASLIDKAPNLGGLCRTCEIFGARKLVLGSNEVMKDPYFKGLSVSSAKWVDVEQVRPADLKPYLERMRREGYSLIGVEQTANSHCLTDYTFPHNTLLLLGNEKEGIPVDLIQLLDVCVEIPQVGIIRSLNVHVSGALLIWEYTRQHMLAGDRTAAHT